MTQPSLFDVPAFDAEPEPPDAAARDFAVDPAHDVVLEASAGTGKTRVLVMRYVRLIEAGVDPRHILGITFTRKAAAEMRERVLAELRQRAELGAIRPDAWRRLRDRVSDIQISTIDAFCFTLLREFPLEADVDPAFEIADETEMARFANEAMDLTFRAARRLIVDDEAVRLLFARLKTPVLRGALRELLDRRQIALPAVATFVKRAATCRAAAEAAARFIARLGDLIASSPYRAAVLDDGPVAVAEFRTLHEHLSGLGPGPGDDPAGAQQLRARLQAYFLTKDRKPRQRLGKAFGRDAFASPDARKRHEAALKALSPDIARVLDAFDADVDALLARGLLRLLVLAVRIYERLLDEHALLDFAGMLARAVALLERQEEFARSRLKLQARYHHILVDEFQDTSRLQWRLVELLIDAWGEGEGVADAPTSIFVVGDRKQSIYRFRHAEVTLLDQAAEKIAALRGDRPVRQAISASFRSVPELLAFVNALSSSMEGSHDIPERFTFADRDRFPVPAIEAGARRDGEPVLGVIAEPTLEGCAQAVASEIERLLAGQLVRDRAGPARPARPEDVAILFRARAGHQYFEEALASRQIRSYVYKGLGFFDAPEVQDLQAMLRCLARPDSDLRAAELLRSRFVRLSDIALTRLQPAFSAALTDPDFDVAAAGLDALDQGLLERAREGVARWMSLADVVPPGELLDLVIRESAYVFELRGRRLDQARENVKKVRALIRRVENRGYATLGRLAEYFETLRAGDESNAIVEAAGAVNLMTIHAAKGLEFPIVFIVNLHVPGRGRPTGFSVIESGPDGTPEVAFGASEATRLEEARDEEELRRLFYVAVTRARDRLYLAAEIDEHAGLRRRTARSLAGLLPSGVAEVFAAAAVTSEDHVRWAGPHGAFDFRVCRPLEAAAPAGAPAAPASPPAGETVRIAPVRAPGRAVSGATDVEISDRDGSEPAGHAGATSDRLLGTLVHRVFERRLEASADEEVIRAVVPRLVRPDERVDAGPLEPLAGRVAAAYLDLRANPELARLLESGQCLYEVPFSFSPPDRPGMLVRGVVDCLVIEPGGRATILELKTGMPRPEHAAQLETYVRGLAAAMPELTVTGRIVYP
jgi:ATP-dependent helicase/nuclease subunit A